MAEVGGAKVGVNGGSAASEDSRRLKSLLDDLVRLELSIQCQISEAKSDFSGRHDAISLISKSMGKLEKLLQDLQILAAEQDTRALREVVQTHVQVHSTEYERLIKQLAMAQRWQVSQASQSTQLQRDRLLHIETGPDAAEAAALRRRNVTKATQVQTARQVSDGLRNIRKLMAAELQKSQAALEVIESSSSTLSNVNTEHENISSLVLVGRGLITRLSRRDFTDRVLIFLGCLLFFFVVAYILKRRLGFTFSSLYSMLTLDFMS